MNHKRLFRVTFCYRSVNRTDCAVTRDAIEQYVKYRVFFKDEETAIAAGYRPCGVCMKVEYKRWKEQKALKNVMPNGIDCVDDFLKEHTTL